MEYSFSGCAEEPGTAGRCLWIEFETLFKIIFNIIIHPKADEKVWAVMAVYLPAVFNVFCMCFETLKSAYEILPNEASYTATDYKCNKHKTHNPIQFEPNIYKKLGIAEQFFKSEGIKFPEWTRDITDPKLKEVIYIFKCRQCTSSTNNNKALYVGLSTNFKARTYSHRHVIKKDLQLDLDNGPIGSKTLPEHLREKHLEQIKNSIPPYKDMLCGYYTIYLTVNIPAAEYDMLRCQEVFYEWLLGNVNIMNKI